MQDPEAKPKRFDIFRSAAKEGARKARKRAKKIFEARSEWGYALMAIYLILASGAGMSLVLSVIPSFFAPDLDDGLRNGVAANCLHGEFKAALEVGVGTAAAWDWMLIVFSVYSIVLAVAVAFVYIFLIRKQEKQAWRNDKDPDNCKEKEKAVDVARVAYYVLMALVFVSFILMLTLFIKYIVILSNSTAGTDITDDADAFIIYWAVLTGISAAASLIYGIFLLSQAMTIKAACMPAATAMDVELSPEPGNLPPPPEGYFPSGDSRMNPWSSSVMTAPFPGFNRRSAAFQH